MTYEAKLNAISRTVLLMTILGFIFTKSASLVMIGVTTLAILVSMYRWKKKEAFTSASSNNKNGNSNGNSSSTKDILRKEFHPTTKKNPFGNVLLTDIGDQPDRLAAAPSFEPNVADDIHRAVTRQTQSLNPTISNTNKQLYGDLYDNYVLDQSMQRFYSTANTRVTNDQGAFSKFLYGDMPSGKEDTPEGAMMRVKDNWQFINP